ncbi:MAG: hypothetical protein ACFFAQ_14060 [Promethearchaeota archaeon]
MTRRPKLKIFILLLIVVLFFSVFSYTNFIEIDEQQNDDKNLRIHQEVYIFSSFELFTFAVTNSSCEDSSLKIEGVKLTKDEMNIFDLIQEFLDNNRVFNRENVSSYIKSRYYKSNGNLNCNGIEVVINSLLKKSIIVEGSKLTRKTILRNSNRKEICNVIKENPGIYPNKLVKKLHLSSYLVNWHLNILLKFNLIRSQKINGHYIYFDFNSNKIDDNLYHTISNDNCRKIIEFLKRHNNGCTKYQIFKALQMHYNTITKYLNEIDKLNILIRGKNKNKYTFSLNHDNFKELESRFFSKN